MSENIGFTDSKDSVHCKKTCLYATFFDLHGHVRVQILTHESMSVCSFEHNYAIRECRFGSSENAVITRILYSYHEMEKRTRVIYSNYD